MDVAHAVAHKVAMPGSSAFKPASRALGQLCAAGAGRIRDQVITS